MREIGKLLLISLIIMGGIAREIQLPIVKDTNSIMLKLGVTKVINQPDIQFQKVYQKKVQKVDEHATYRFAPCQSNRPQIQFNVYEQIVIQNVPKRPSVFFNFYDIQYSQFLLDVFYDNPNPSGNSYIYIMFKNHLFVNVTMQKTYEIIDKKMIKILQINKDQFMEVGYFIKLNNQIMFVNNKYAIPIPVGSNQIKPLDGYMPIDDFQTVIALQGDYFAVMGINQGIIIYQYNQSGLKKITQMKSQILFPNAKQQILDLRDMVYYKQKNILIIIDKNRGVKTYILSIGENIQLKQSNPLSQQRNCKLLYLFGNQLYVDCWVLKVYKLDKWPKAQFNYVTFPQTQIRQIFKAGDVTAFVGRSGFSIMYLNTIVNSYQDKSMNKLIMTDRLFISVDQKGLKVGPYKIIQPYVSCNTENTNFLGTTNLIFTTTAQCHEEYFKKYKVDKQKYGQIGPDDVCKYTVTKPITIWKVGQFNPEPLIIGFLILFLVVLVVVCLQMCHKLKLNRYRRLIEQFNTNKVSESAKHQDLAEQIDGSQNKNQKNQNKQSQEQLGDPNMHDI